MPLGSYGGKARFLQFRYTLTTRLYEISAPSAAIRLSISGLQRREKILKKAVPILIFAEESDVIPMHDSH